MLNDQFSGTWISLDERPPPRSAEGPGKLWLWFRFRTEAKPALGYLNTAGRVELLRRRARVYQRELLLDDVTHWKPMSEFHLEEVERRA